MRKDTVKYLDLGCLSDKQMDFIQSIIKGGDVILPSMNIFRKMES